MTIEDYNNLKIYKKYVACKKCGQQTGIFEHHHDKLTKVPFLSSYNGEQYMKYREVFERECCNCGYIWYERPLDSENSEKEKLPIVPQHIREKLQNQVNELVDALIEYMEEKK